MEGVNRFGMAGSSDLREPSLESAGAAAFTQRLEHGNPRFHFAVFRVQPLDVVEQRGKGDGGRWAAVAETPLEGSNSNADRPPSRRHCVPAWMGSADG